MAWWAGQPVYGSNPTSRWIRENFEYLKTYTDYILNSGVTTADLAAVHAAPPTLAAVVNITVNTVLGNTDVGLGGGYNISAGITLTVNGAFSAPATRIFFGAGTVVFNAGSVREVYPEWWATNTTPGTTDMTAAINAAIASITGGIVFFHAVEYAVTSTVRSTVAQPPIILQGASCYPASLGTRIKWIGGNNDSIVELSSFMNLRDMYIYNGNSATGIIGVDMLGSGIQPKTTNLLNNVAVKGCAIGFAYNWAYYTTNFNCSVSYCTTGFDLRTEANNVDFYGCRITTCDVGISGFNSTGTSQVLYSGGSIEACTVYGIKCSSFCQGWVFHNTYFESNHQHLINGYTTIYEAHLNHEGKDGGIAGVNPAFDIAGAMDVTLSIASMSNDVTRLFILSGLAAAYAPDSVKIDAKYHKAAVAASIFESPFLRDGYITNDSFTLIETPWYDASGPISELLITIGERWKADRKKLVLAYMVVDTIVVVAGTFTVTFGESGGYNHVNSTWNTDRAVGVHALTLIPTVPGVAETIAPGSYSYRVTGTDETSGRYKVVIVLI